MTDKLRFRIKNKRKSENSYTNDNNTIDSNNTIDNNTTDNTIDNNTNDNNTIDNTIDNISIDNTIVSKIRDKIRDIRVILNRLGNIVTKKDKKKIKKELYEIENKNNLSDNEKKEIYDHLDRLIGTFVKKDKHKHNDHDDLYYYGIRDIENSFDDYNDNDYLKGRNFGGKKF